MVRNKYLAIICVALTMLFWVKNQITFAEPTNAEETAAALIRAQDSIFIAHFSEKLKVQLDSCSNKALIAIVADWIGVPYRSAGHSKNGIDCSGFVSKIYNEVFCVKLTHSSAGMLPQMKMRVPKSQLQEGDIIFFKINKSRISHVGLYLKDNKFVHASPGRGIVVDDLNQPYYKKYYYTAGRPI